MVKIEDYKWVCSSLIRGNFHGFTGGMVKQQEILNSFDLVVFIDISIDLIVIIRRFDPAMYMEISTDLQVELMVKLQDYN